MVKIYVKIAFDKGFSECSENFAKPNKKEA